MNMFFYKMSSKNIMLVRIALLANYIEVDARRVVSGLAGATLK